MKRSILIGILSLGAPLALQAQDQNPVEKTGKTVEHGAQATGRTVEHGVQATERTVGKGLKKTGNTLEKAGPGAPSKHHVRTGLAGANLAGESDETLAKANAAGKIC